MSSSVISLYGLFKKASMTCLISSSVNGGVYFSCFVLTSVSALISALSTSKPSIFALPIVADTAALLCGVGAAKAAAKLVGIGKASAEMRANLLENGLRVDCPSYGQSMPDRIIDLRLPGFFNMMDGTGGEENAIFDILEDVEKEKEAALDNLK